MLMQADMMPRGCANSDTSPNSHELCPCGTW